MTLDKTPAWFLRTTVLICILTAALSLLYIHFLGKEHRRLSTELAELKLQITTLSKDVTATNLVLSSRIDYIEQVLFGEVVAKLNAPQKQQPASRLADWQKNRDRELRDRIIYLERRMFALESTISEKLK